MATKEMEKAVKPLVQINMLKFTYPGIDVHTPPGFNALIDDFSLSLYPSDRCLLVRSNGGGFYLLAGIFAQAVPFHHFSEFKFNYDIQDYYKILSRCVKENLVFKMENPWLLQSFYSWLVHWHSFDFERTTIFDLLHIQPSFIV